MSPLLATLKQRGVEPLLVRGKLRLVGPRGQITPDLVALVRIHAAELKAALPETVDPTHVAENEIDRLAATDGWKPQPGRGHPAYSIVETCRRYGVALRIDPDNGDLVVGKAGYKVDEATQPWRTLLIAIEAHLEAVAVLVEGRLAAQGWLSETGRGVIFGAGAMPIAESFVSGDRIDSHSFRTFQFSRERMADCLESITAPKT